MTPLLPKEGVAIEHGGTICLKIIDKVREYNLGDFIKFSPVELNEICLLFQLATDDIVKSTGIFAKSIGIQDAEQSAAEDSVPSPQR